MNELEDLGLFKSKKEEQSKIILIFSVIVTLQESVCVCSLQKPEDFGCITRPAYDGKRLWAKSFFSSLLPQTVKMICEWKAAGYPGSAQISSTKLAWIHFKMIKLRVLKLSITNPQIPLLLRVDRL